MSNYKHFVEENGYCLKVVGVDNFCLTKDKALEAIKLAKDEGVAVLGGDVYEKDGSVFRLTYDNWFSDKKLSESDGDYLIRAASESVAFIESYKSKEAFYALTFDD